MRRIMAEVDPIFQSKSQQNDAEEVVSQMLSEIKSEVDEANGDLPNIVDLHFKILTDEVQVCKT